MRKTPTMSISGEELGHFELIVRRLPCIFCKTVFMTYTLDLK